VYFEKQNKDRNTKDLTLFLSLPWWVMTVVD
jgi:hypothetical protein